MTLLRFALRNARHNLPVSGEKAVLKGFYGASFARFLAAEQKTAQNLFVIVTDDLKRCGILQDEIGFFNPDARIGILPPYDVFPYHGLSPHPQIVSESVKVLSGLIDRNFDFLIVPEKALWRRRVPRTLFESLVIRAVEGFAVSRDDMVRDLVFMGYERTPVVEDRGQFAVRGDVLDVFSPHESRPVRLSFFDRDIESIRYFSSETQRTEEKIHDTKFIPTREIFLNYLIKKNNDDDTIVPEEIRRDWKSLLKNLSDTRDFPKPKRDQIEDFIQAGIYFHGIETFLPLFCTRTDSLFEYFPKNTVLVRDTSGSLAKALGDFLRETESQRERSQHVESVVAPESLFLTSEEITVKVKTFPFLENVVGTDAESREILGDTETNQEMRTRLGAQIAKVHNLAPLASELNQKRLENARCYVICRNDLQLERTRDLLQRFDLPLRVTPENAAREAESGNGDARLVTLGVGGLHEGFFDIARREWWIADEEIFGKKTRRSTKGAAKTSVFSSFSELEEGDYLIHMDHGIGIYRGLVKLSFDVHQNDFLTIEYLGGDKLYVPVDRLNRVQRYAAEEGSTPQLDKLGGTTWIKTRAKAKKAARKIAAELLKMQALREVQKKTWSFQPHVDEMAEFAGSFEFEETPDQDQAIEDVLRDMGSERPMDRLVCGDVGFGKTEVAIRAAYKAILDKKQVAVLVPTTVLAFQHYTTFRERFKSYAANVELLSRFRSDREQNDVVKKLKEGKVDIVVGTHRLLSQDIRFLDLGLLIIDEEHRFGVIHKEKIKKLKNLVDVMTLTATPIPRTLNFALNGIRDLSVINTPPVDRLSVKTYATSFDEATLKDAMLKEIRRGGQVYFVHNRVQSIEKITVQIHKMLPDARIRFAHGQMDEGQLEKIMIDFMSHEFDVLVCTTIIESGLDIPNCNTMIINRADQMGLAQLYQLRGRVGRSHHQAYCYLVVPDEELVNPKAKKRLAAIQKFTELGSGFKIASHDLEIRGAGNILGDEQSGHIAAVGYDMYLHLLKEAVHELKNEALPEDFAPEVALQVPAKIPEEFVPDAHLRLLLYKQVSSAEKLEEVNDIADEWSDRFGKLPDDVKNLFEIIRIRILCREILITTLKQSGDRIVVSFHPQHRVDTAVLADAIQRNPKKFSLARDGAFVITHPFKDAAETLAWTKDFLGKLVEARTS